MKNRPLPMFLVFDGHEDTLIQWVRCTLCIDNWLVAIPNRMTSSLPQTINGVGVAANQSTFYVTLPTRTKIEL